MKKHNTKMKGKKVLSMLLALIMVLSVGSPAFSPMLGIIAKAAASYPVELAFENIFVFEQWASNKSSTRITSDGGGGENDGTLSNVSIENGSFRLTNNINTNNVYTTASMSTGDTADENGAFYSMPVEEGVTYNLDYNATGNAPGGFFPYVFFYDDANEFKSLQNGAATGYGDNRFTFTVPEDMTHIQVRFTLGPASSGSAYVDLKNIAIYKTETVDAPITELFDFATWSTKTGSGGGTSVYADGTRTINSDAQSVTLTSSGAESYVGGCSALLTNFSLGTFDDTTFTIDTEPGKTYTLTFTLSDVTFDSAKNCYLSALIPWYNSSNAWINSYGEKKFTEEGQQTYTFTVPNDVYHFQIVFGLYDFSKTNGVGATVSNISLYEVVEDSIISHKVDPTRKVYTYAGDGATYGELPTPPAATIPEGYIFAGWYTGKDGTGIRIASDTKIQPMSYTVYPKFEPAVDSLVVTTPPAKTEYTVGEKLNTAGLVLTATIDDGSGAEGSVSTFNIASGYYCTPEYLTATGTQTITAHYGGKTATFTVNVSAGVEKNIVVNGVTQSATVANNEYILNYQAPSPFNRYEMTYSSDSYVKGEISMDDGIIEEFFLEPSDNGSFASYIDSFLRNVNHYGIDSIKFTCLDKEYGNFELKSLTTISSPVPSDPMQYYENDEYKVGISLDFGGVVSYIEDLKNKPVARVYNENGNNITKVDYANKLSASGVLQESNSVNLINTWDRGRYLQQSYYGTYDKPYNLGNYNGLDWNYNPVQGGNIKGDASKVIDYRITDDQIYVKTRPLDWGKWSENYGDEYVDEYITDSYMEAWYVFEDGMIKTYCRFVDYSGYPSNTTTQEFPALYTIEPLNHFVYNEVDEAWSEDNLVKIEEPEFWGILPDYNALLQANGMSAVNPDRVAVENWAAFTASDDADSFGIGVYSPGVTDMHFGTYPAIYNEQEVTNNNRLVANYRHAQTVDPAVEGPTSYIAPVDIMTFESYKPSTYSFYITTGTAEEIHNDFETVAKKDSQAELDKSKIAVPETVYMTPADGASKVGQYYVNNIMDEDDNYNIKTEAVRDAGMYLGLHIKDAKEFSVKVTNVTDPTNDIFLCNTSGSEISESTRIPFEAAGTYENDTQYGLRFSGTGLAPGEKATAKWEITVYLEDGTTETYTAYTVLYAPGRTVGAVAEARQVDASQNEISSWITGANGVDHSQRAPLGSFHGDISASGYFKEDPLYSAVPASGSSGTANDYINVDSENTYVLQTATNGHDGSRAQSYLGLLTVDKSRYTNTNQIPNLQIGYDVLRKGSYTNNSIGKYTTYYTLGTESAYTATSLSDAPSGWTVYSGTYTDFASDHSIPYRESFVPSFDVSTIDGKYIHALNQALADQTINANQYSTAGTSVLCSVTDKSELRDSVLDGYNISKDDYSDDSYNKMVEELEDAATVLGDPSATQDEIDNAQKELDNALEGLVETFYALKYDNLFSAYEFSQHPSSMTMNQANSTVGYSNGVITVENDTLPEGATETYTRYASSDDYYLVDLKPNTEYVFEYDVTTSLNAQVFMFFYNKDGGNGDVPTNMSVQRNGGAWGSKSESNPWWGNYTNGAGSYHYVIKFTTGANTTKAGFRFGNTSNAPTTSTFSNIRLIDAAHYYEDVTYSATEAVYKEYASYGTLVTPVRTGHTFTGWQDASGNAVTGADIATEHKSVYSQWEDITYTIAYNANGGSGSVASQTVKYTQDVTLASSGFTRSGYKLLGWSTDPNATVATYQLGQTTNRLTANPNGTVTLYAVWAEEKVDVNVTFDNLIDFDAWNKTANNGTVSNVTDTGFTITSNDGAGEATSGSPFFAVTPGKQYKVEVDFEGDGWDVYVFFCDESGAWVDFADGTNRFSSNGGGVPATKDGSTYSAIFTAPDKAEVVKAQIRVDANGSNNTVSYNNIRVYEYDGTAINVTPVNKFVTKGDSYGELPTPEKAGHKFLGWYDSDGNQITSSSILESATTVFLTSKWEKYDPLAADTVVIDYGLPVKIDVLSNDLGVTGGTLTKIGKTLPSNVTLNTGLFDASQLTDGVTSGLELTSGTAKIESGVVVYTPSNMQMSEEDVFYYEYQTTDGKFCYAEITVIPATSIYYEDSFFTFNDNGKYTWKTAGTTLTGKYQSADIPGVLDNVYGSDTAYEDSTTYSLGSARYTTVDMDARSIAKAPSATFTFSGTGFDLFSVTSSDTGTVMVAIKNSSGSQVANYIVNTYHGYTLTDDGSFSPNPENKDTLYQVPVISARDLGYNTYTVTVTPMYSHVFDPNYDSSKANSENAYSIYIDSVRIFDPAGSSADVENNPVIKDAYLDDGEYAPQYLNAREVVIDNKEIINSLKDGSSDYAMGTVYVDAGETGKNADIETYEKVGPNNEVYLGKNQAIAFKISSDSAFTIDSLQLGMKVVSGGESAEVVVMNTNTKQPTAISVNGSTETYKRIDSAVVWKQSQSNGTQTYETEYPIVIINRSDAVISLTSFKWTFGRDSVDSASVQTLDFFVDSETPMLAYSSMKRVLSDIGDDVEIEWLNDTTVVGRTAKLIVTAPVNIVKVTVDGITLTEWEYDQYGRKRWSYTFVTEEAGDYSYEVVVSDEYETSSKPMKSPTLTVNESTSGSLPSVFEIVLNFIKSLLEMFRGLF